MKQIEENTILRDSINGIEMVMCLSGYAILDSSWYGNEICAPFNKLFLIESGEGFLKIGEEIITMRPGMAYLIPAKTRYSYYCEKDLTKLFFHFNLLKPDHYDLLQNIDKIFELEIPTDLLQNMLRAYGGQSFADGMVVKEGIYRMLNRFFSTKGLAQETLPRYSHHVLSTIGHVLDNLSANLCVEELAQQQYISKSYLEKLFRKEVGVSVGRYIDDQLMTAAQIKLDQTNLSVAQISQELGFTEPYYFSRRFKQLCGVTPLGYRKQRRLQSLR